ncbi:MAG: POTRA domain-containing protein, partial [Pyrinomonadaceae bacterium]
AGACIAPVFGQNQFEKRRISGIDVTIIGAEANSPLIEQYRIIAREALGPIYSTPRVRDAIDALYQTKRIDTITVAASLDPTGDVGLKFTVKPKTQAGKVTIELGPSDGDKVSEEDLLFKLSLLSPGAVITEQTLKNNADEILDYLRERGFYRSQVVYERRPLLNQNEVGVTFKVTPNEQATVASFAINIEGYAKPIPLDTLKLEPGKVYSRDRLTADIAKIRDLLKKDKFLAPMLDEPRVTYDSDRNTIAIVLSGKVGATVEVVVDSETGKMGNTTQTRLLPIKRDGTLDYAAIVEGERRLENYYQERGYFFTNVTPVCSVKPAMTDAESNAIANETEFLCSFLGGEELIGKEVEVKYRVNLDRRLRLTEIRVRGTDKLAIDDIRTVLGSQEANLLGIIPILGYGRGYTSAAILEEDTATVRSLMAELGYREAQVRVNQGVSPNGEELIITFVVEEGPASVITDVGITGNTAVPTAELMALLPELTGRNYSRARVRNAARKLSEHYSNLGYYYARVTPALIEPANDPNAAQRDVKIEFRIEHEGKKVLINRIIVGGNEMTKTSAVLRALALEPGELLRAVDVYTSEQTLYGTDAFARVDIKPQPAGDVDDGTRKSDILVSVDEQPPRLLSYGAGFSTDLGLSGFFDIRHVNLFGNLWQGGARVKVSQRQQLIQFDFINPRFMRDGKKRFAPLTLSLQYQRDSTVTRFFRSAFDKGTFGIVQRVDEDGNPIDEFGNGTGDPTINRLALTAETSRTISRKDRSIVFLRYRFEDVRLFDIESLLVADLLRPDQKVRISGFGVTFVRDTRRNCSIKYSLLDLIAKGDQTDPCRYNASDPTNGDYLTADYNVSLKAIGGNIGFQKFQASYNYYYTFGRLKNTTIAARGILGLGHVFSGGDRFTSVNYPSLNGLLPISERF